MINAAVEILRKHWGYDQFRSLQENVVQSVLNKEDALVLMPTGGGKSICYQVPALQMEGFCLVISPLIALMKDQVDHLKKRGVEALAIYSGMSYRDIDREIENLIYGKYKFLYISPERLKSDLFLQRLDRMNISFVAIDEAHCISQWGYDFRPSYMEINELRRLKPEVPFLALTATATPEVQKDIADKLELVEPAIHIDSFARANLAYLTCQTDNKSEKLLELVKENKESGIVYTRSRKSTKRVSDFLKQKGVSSSFYHAGLSAKERVKRQGAWMNGDVQWMVCTNAFGMGIDKSNVGMVLHLELPNSLEEYFQEAGRAGRDGAYAKAILLYNEADKTKLRVRHEKSHPELEEVRKVYQALGNHVNIPLGSGLLQSYDFDLYEFCNSYKFNMASAYHSTKILAEADYIALSDGFHIPSKLHMRIDSGLIYKFYVMNPYYEEVLKKVLRTYGGSFENYVEIYEPAVAHGTNLSVAQVIEQLQELKKQEVLDYVPQKDKPQLSFLTERLPQTHLNFDEKMIAFRKELKRKKLEAMIAYVEAQRCRSQELLNYFGETKSNACGHCDVCLGTDNFRLTDESFRNVCRKIFSVVRNEKVSSELLVAKVVTEEKETVLDALRWLLDNGYLNEKGKVLVEPK